MKSIDECKKEILLMVMSGEELSYEYIGTLPKDDSLRTFMCSLSAYYAYMYVRFIDKSPRDDTRKAACRDPGYAFWYAYYVDKSPHEDTRKAACGHHRYAYWYAKEIDDCPHPETRKAAYRDPDYKEQYIKEFGE